MKKYFALLLMIVFPAAAFAQERSIGVALERYGVVAGGWWLNKKCNFISGEEAKVFSRDVAVVNTSLTTTLDNPNLVLSIQASGKRVSESETSASCPKQAQEIVAYAVPEASCSNATTFDLGAVIDPLNTRNIAIVSSHSHPVHPLLQLRSTAFQFTVSLTH